MTNHTDRFPVERPHIPRLRERLREFNIQYEIRFSDVDAPVREHA